MAEFTNGSCCRGVSKGGMALLLLAVLAAAWWLGGGALAAQQAPPPVAQQAPDAKPLPEPSLPAANENQERSRQQSPIKLSIAVPSEARAGQPLNIQVTAVNSGK